LEVFKKFEVVVEINSKRNIKAIWSDNNDELIFKVFKDHNKVKGIQH
jgi:hypothetical protein